MQMWKALTRRVLFNALPSVCKCKGKGAAKTPPGYTVWAHETTEITLITLGTTKWRSWGVGWL